MGTPADNPFPAAYAPEGFRALGHRVVDTLADHLAQVQGREGPVLPWRSPEAALAAWPGAFTRAGGGDFHELLERVVEESHHLHHPRYVGHQCSAPLPLTALLGAVSDLLNNGSAVYEMGPVNTAMERALVRWFSGLAGFDPTLADGVWTHGGSAGNLTALLAARQAAAPNDVWEEGYREPGGLCVVTSEQAHYSVRRSAQVLGLGGKSVIPVAVDERFRMRPAALAATLDRLAAEGKKVLAVVASAGSTATGAIDPLEAIADHCQRRGVWLHVDGAHSGAYLLSDRLKPALKGIERSDSLVVDAHKMMMMPSLATLVLFQDGERSFETFSQEASYLFDRSARQEWFNYAHRTLECTKRMLGLKLYLALEVMGTDFFASFVERMHDLAGGFARTIAARPGWELAVHPESNIVCFRFIPDFLEDVDGFQSRVREALVREGSFYLVKTVLGGQTWLRTTLVNPLTTEADLEGLLARVEAHAQPPQAPADAPMR
jgi:L-2,4-diaminobutyrate decarboxylase